MIVFGGLVVCANIATTFALGFHQPLVVFENIERCPVCFFHSLEFQPECIFRCDAFWVNPGDHEMFFFKW
jgi:hypothetical protein